MFFSNKTQTPLNFVRKNPESEKKRYSRKTKVSQFVGSAMRNIDFPARVAIFDTTLRDGEGTPGVNFTLEEKVEMAKALDTLGVAVIEAGSPVTSKAEKKTFKRIAELGPQAKICGLAKGSTTRHRSLYRL